jgi:hypothetical protein
MLTIAVLVVAVFGLVVFFYIDSMRPPEPYHPDIEIHPAPSDLDLHTEQIIEIRLIGGGEIVGRLGVSTTMVNFNSNGESICLYGNFTVTGNLDGLIDFFILTESGYIDFMTDGSIDSQASIFQMTIGTTGFYWNYTLPYFFNGQNVDVWYIVYSAYTKYEGVFEIGAAFRDVTAEVYEDQTPPRTHRGDFPHQVVSNNTFEVELWAWDLRCSVSSVEVLANDSSIEYWTGTYGTFHEMLQWDTTGFSFGNYTLTIIVTDAAGNSQTYLIGYVSVVEPWQPPVEEIVDSGRVLFGVFSFLLVVCRFYKEFQSSEVVITVISTVVNVVPIFGPLQLFNQIATIISLIAASIAIWKEVRIRLERRRAIPSRPPEYYG